MRTLNAGALTEIAKQYGNQPLIIISVDWKGDGGVLMYSDKNLPGIPGKILEIGTINSQLTPTTGNNAEVNVRLDDTDGTIKAIINYFDPHKRACNIYQYFGDMSTSDKFVIVKGVVTSPFTWNEGDRTVAFNVLTEIENKEVGFSLEETQIDFINSEDIGKTWPLVFGNCVHIPTAQIKKTNSCTLEEAFTIVDPTIAHKKQMLIQAYLSQELIRQYFQSVFAGADAIAPECRTILTNYIAAIKFEDTLQEQFNLLLVELEQAKRDVADATNPVIKIFAETHVTNVEAAMELLSAQMFTASQNKELIEVNAETADKEAKIKKECIDRQLAAYNAMRSIYADYLDLTQQECEQTRLTKTVVRVQDGIKFPQNIPMDVLIKNVQWRVSFNGDLMTILAGPIPKYRNIPVTPAVADSCENSTIGAFTVPAGYDLRDTYIWCKNKNFPHPTGRMHILKVRAQEGTKVYFDLVAFEEAQDNSSGGGGGLINSQSQLPAFTANSLTNMLNGASINPNFNPCKDLSNEVANLLGASTLNTISKEEYDHLLKIQCNLPADELADSLIIVAPTPRDVYTIIGEDILELTEVSGSPLPHWFDFGYNTFVEEIPESGFWKADPGSQILDINNICELHVVNILPSTIKAVHCYRNTEDARFLAQVPSSFYAKNEAESWGGLTLTTLRLKVPMAWHNDGWEDTLYVTLESSVGSNVVDILEHLIETYTNKTVDATSFNYVRTLFGTKYPANFPLFTRPNVFEILNQIAWQARCVLILSNDVFYLKYLAEEPTSNATITDSDVDLTTLKMTTQATEDITTKMTCTWRPNHLPEEPQYVILRNNVAKYGLHERDVDFFIYNIQELVVKSATFWLIRESNSWKQVSFDTFLTKLELETYDTITLDLNGDYFSTSPVKAVIVDNVYNSTDHTISINCWLPVRMGEMTQYPFAWPAGLAADVEYVATGGTGIGISIVDELLGCA